MARIGVNVPREALRDGTAAGAWATRRGRLLLAAVPVHLALSFGWAWGIAFVAPRGREVPFGAAAGLAIAGLDLGVIGRRFPRIRSLRPLPQVADHLAFGLTVGWVLTRRRA
jgi:hypothetical protein